MRHRLRLEKPAAGCSPSSASRRASGAAREQRTSSACTMLLWTLLASGQIAMRKIDGQDGQASAARTFIIPIAEKMETESLRCMRSTNIFWSGSLLILNRLFVCVIIRRLIYLVQSK
jgi:hypothetical protein